MLGKFVSNNSVRRAKAINRGALLRPNASIPYNPQDPKVAEALVQELSLQQLESAKTVVPWFLRNMPVRFRVDFLMH